MTDTFIERASSELKTLMHREHELAVQEETARRERAEIRARVAALVQLLEGYRDFMGISDAPKPDAPRLFPDDSSHVNGATITLGTTADMAEAIMARQGGHAKIREILDELVRAGKLSGKEGDYGSVFGTLKRNPRRFKKIAAGEFALVSPAGSQASEQQVSSRS